MNRTKLFYRLATVVATILVPVFGSPATRAQEPAPSSSQIKFEVISIKPNNSGSDGHHSHFTHGRYVAVNISAKELIHMAYGLVDYQLTGAPDWVNSDQFDIDAKMEDAAAEAMAKLSTENRREEYRQLFQSLLADRFGLKVTHETRDLPVFALVVAKGGVKFSPTKLPPVVPGTDPSQDPAQAKRGSDVSSYGRDEYIATGNGVKMSSWATVLSDQPELGGRLAIDETGLAGEYDLTLKWTQQRPSDIRDTPVGAPAALDASGPSLFTALQEQLGLKLESKKGPVDTIAIVHIEHPSGN